MYSCFPPLAETGTMTEDTAPPLQVTSRAADVDVYACLS